MKKSSILAWSTLLVTVIGCGPQSADSSAANGTGSTNSSAVQAANAKPAAGAQVADKTSLADTKSAPSSATADPQAGSKNSTPATDSKSEPPPGPPLKLPPDLDTDGLQYLGFTRTKPIDIEATGTGINHVLTGSQTAVLKGIKDGQATFEIDRTGGLSILGTDVETADKDGVYEVSSSIGKYSPHAMDMPAHPKPGMKWTFHVSADESTAQMDMETTCRVVDFETVTTKAGTFKDALVVSQIGVGKLQHKDARTEFKIWYVKGLGAVKAVQTVHMADGKTEKLTLEETSKG